VWSDGTQWRTNYLYNALTRIVEKSASGATVLADVTGIPSWVNLLRVELDVKFATDNNQLVLQTYDSGGSLSTGSSDYYYVGLAASTGSATAVATATGSAIMVDQGINNSANHGLVGWFQFANFQGGNQSVGLTDIVNWLEHTTGNGWIESLAGRRQAPGNLTGFKLAPGSGNCTGTVRVFAAN
jgi:hypothetical protein